jgi:hypothetical protein
MVGDLVAVGDHASDPVGVYSDELPRQEHRCPDIGGPQAVEDLSRDVCLTPAIERQCDLASRQGAALDIL